MRKKIFISVIAVSIFIIALLAILNSKNDGMENTKQVKIYYKTYTNNGWSKWSKNGITSGNYNDSIKNIKVKVKSKTNGYIVYNIYSNDEWIENEPDDNQKDLKGLKLANVNTLNKKFDICYRTYNKKDKWLSWTCNGNISGNINENITALEIKIIPKNIVKYDWLKDYNKTLKASSIDFEE